MRRTMIGTVFFALMTALSHGNDSSDAEFFEGKVRPLLIAKCQECHGDQKAKSGLRLDSRGAILTGGDSGPAAVSGKPDESLLIDVISYRNVVQMPPKAKLSDTEIATLTEWVRRGLPWPNSQPVAGPGPANAPIEFTEEQKSFWAFQPVRREAVPMMGDPAWARSAIDRFVQSRHLAAGLAAAPEADRRTLLRRLSLDLTGLPPTPDDVEEFLADPSPDALERVVDRLLASPRYGERWGRHWLDVARYADSNGLDENLAYGNAYRYRDYVVKSFREDKPYDRFLVEQIAGDLLELPDPQESFDALVATGFLCLGAKMLAEDDPVKMQMDIIDEQVDTMARAVMGLTMGCARCHDHKFDPLTAEDYYGLAGIFKSTRTMDNFSVVARWHERPLATPTQLRDRDALKQLADEQKQSIEKLKSRATRAILREQRQHAAAYLLAATREQQLATLLQSAKPRGIDSDPAQIPGALLIEAEDFLRGNVQKDRTHYGLDIGVLVNMGQTPNFSEYEISVEKRQTYQLEIRYAAAASRPVKLFVNGELVKSDAAGKVTGTWFPDSQTWFVECFVQLNPGRNLIRLEQPQVFPHLDKLLLTPADASVEISAIAGLEKPVRLIPSLVRQWTAALQNSRTDPKSVLTAWHQFLATKQLQPDSSIAESAVARLLGATQPASLAELANRYEELFAETQTAWEMLPGDGEKGKTLTDPVLEAINQLLRDSKGPYAVPEDIETSFSEDVVTQLKGERDELARREASVPLFPEAMAVADTRPENLKIHLRGSHLTLGREVPHLLPRILAGSGSRELSEGSGRLPLARWLTRPDHPLTGRVLVNRVWQWHFGHGLVRSPDNFGRLGDRPSHPELLDWLASEFSREGTGEVRSPRAWSLKSLHRQLLSSATYRQSTDYNESFAQADPQNRLLWRFHRQRMDVEVLRDSLLAVNGRLDETPGGTMLPTANRAYVTSTASVNPAIYNSNRRAIYLPVIRSALYDVFTAFDFADPSTLAGQRDQTTIAPQALFMMNSGFVLAQCQSLASLLRDRNDSDPADTVRHLYRLAYSRDPSTLEVQRAIDYLGRMRAAVVESGVTADQVESRAWTSLCRAVLAANEFVYIE